MNMRLHTFQSNFRDYLYRGRCEEELVLHTRESGCTDPRQRLSVYRAAYFTRLERALAHDFPATEKAMGQEMFARAAAQYVLARPSRSPTLRDLGRFFADWLREHHGSELGDLSNLEWALMEAFDGPDAEPVDSSVMNDFTPEDWPDLSVSCVPTLTLLTCTSNAHEFWTSAKHDEITELESTPISYLAVWRGPKGPTYDIVDRQSYLVMKTLQSLPVLACVCDELRRSMAREETIKALAAVLQQALALGWICRISKKI